MSQSVKESGFVCLNKQGVFYYLVSEGNQLYFGNREEMHEIDSETVDRIVDTIANGKVKVVGKGQIAKGSLFKNIEEREVI